jgi:hypothetical protein
VGGSQTHVQDRFGNGEAGHVNFNGEANGKKAFAGYMFFPWLGVEVGYQDFGTPDESFHSRDVKLEVDSATGWTGEVLAQLPVGPFDLFAKAGVVSYDAKLVAHSISTGAKLGRASDNGEEFAVGSGVAVNIQQLSIRGEYEYFDIADGVGVYSLSAIWHFHI